MKKLLLLLLFVSATMITSAQHSITVKGSIKYPTAGVPVKVIQADGSRKTVIDSIFLKSDNTFEKRVTLPHAGRFTLSGQDHEYLSFWGEDEDVEVHFRGAASKEPKGRAPLLIHNPGKNNELMNLVAFFLYVNNNNMLEVRRQMQAARESGSKEWIAYAEEVASNTAVFRYTLMDYMVSTYRDRNSVVLHLGLAGEQVRKEVISFLEETKPDYPPFVAYQKEQAFQAAQHDKLLPGNPTPAFSYPTPDGKKRLGPADFKGKYLLLDFWASWCGPCRGSIPHLKEVYAKYHSKGFDILSISIDQNEGAWHKAMKEENMPWGQVLAPESGKEIQKLYQFLGIPHMLLVDREGKILFVNARGKLLDDLMAKLFD